MPGWYYDKKELRNTPSAIHGIDFRTEMRYRKEGARFIVDTGMKMDLGYNTTATGIVYFHRFYMFHSFHQFPRYVTACCCLFLAGKVEETPKKCKDIIKIARNLLSDQKFSTFGDDPKEEVMTLERILLQTIKFDLQVEHPYQYLLKYAKCLKGDKEKLQKMVQMAWTFVNDSLFCTTLCLQWEPEIIALALIYLAGKLSKFEVVDWVARTPKHLRWWDIFVEGVTMDLLEDICHQVLDLYSQSATKSPSPSPPPSVVNRPTSPASQNNRQSNGNEKPVVSPETVPPPINTQLPPPSDIPQFPYQTFTHAPPPLTYAAITFSAPPGNGSVHMSGPLPGPPPHITAPPPTVFSSFINHPPPFTAVVPPPTGPPFYTNGPPPATQGYNPPHRPYFPPP